MDRRAFLRYLTRASAAVVAGGFAAGCSSSNAKVAESAPRRGRRPGPLRAVHEVDGLPIADWVLEENRRRGSLDWVIRPTPLPPGVYPPWPAPIEGYADHVSCTRGEEVGLYVSTSAASFHAEAYRIGYYGGLGGRLVARTPTRPGRRQPLPAVVPGINLVECHWQRSVAFEIGAEWTPGCYLIKLVASNGETHYVPLTVRDDTSLAAIVVQNEVTTWQAYNLWGGYSLYGGGPEGVLADRSRVVSFDRPYRNPDEGGSGGFIGTELPFVYLAERLGLDVTYWTDLDLHARPELLGNHHCLVSLGHDEYWSWQMRFNGVMDHLKGGLSVMFLGANACYRQIRVEASPLGPNRRIICYKDAIADPIARTDPKLATGVSWASDLVAYPESEMIGTMYQAYGANAPFVVTDASSWVYDGTGLRDGDALSDTSGNNIVGSEFDAFEPALPGPRNVQILAHSPCSSVIGPLHSDASYYTHPGGGGVFDTGTANWIRFLWDGARPLQDALSYGVSPLVDPVTRITLNVLANLARPGAAMRHPSKPNWQSFYAPDMPPVASVD
jgi:hypothetical protein